MASENPLRILCITKESIRGLSIQEIFALVKANRKTLLSLFHPDKNKQAGAEDRYKEIGRAFEQVDIENGKREAFEKYLKAIRRPQKTAHMADRDRARAREALAIGQRDEMRRSMLRFWFALLNGGEAGYAPSPSRGEGLTLQFSCLNPRPGTQLFLAPHVRNLHLSAQGSSVQLKPMTALVQDDGTLLVYNIEKLLKRHVPDEEEALKNDMVYKRGGRFFRYVPLATQPFSSFRIIGGINASRVDFESRTKNENPGQLLPLSGLPELSTTTDVYTLAAFAPYFPYMLPNAGAGDLLIGARQGENGPEIGILGRILRLQFPEEGSVSIAPPEGPVSASPVKEDPKTTNVPKAQAVRLTPDGTAMLDRPGKTSVLAMSLESFATKYKRSVSAVRRAAEWLQELDQLRPITKYRFRYSNGRGNPMVYFEEDLLRMLEMIPDENGYVMLRPLALRKACSLSRFVEERREAGDHNLNPTLLHTVIRDLSIDAEDQKIFTGDTKNTTSKVYLYEDLMHAYEVLKKGRKGSPDDTLTDS